MVCICKVGCVKKKYFTPFPSIINGYTGNKDSCKKKKKTGLKKISDIYVENGSFGGDRIFSSKDRRNKDAFVTLLFLIQGELSKSKWQMFTTP